MKILKERFRSFSDQVRMLLGLVYEDSFPTPKKGEVFIRVEDADTGELIEERHIKNVITLDAGLLASTLMLAPTSRNGINMLAVGTGATGAVLSPDAPDPKQRKLNAEIARKTFSSTTYRDASGNAVSIRTDILDMTTTFEAGEAVGPLNEMGLMSTISDNTGVQNLNPDTYPTRDVTVDVDDYDILVNYLTFGVISIPATARWSLTWRITF